MIEYLTYLRGLFQYTDHLSGSNSASHKRIMIAILAKFSHFSALFAKRHKFYARQLSKYCTCFFSTTQRTFARVLLFFVFCMRTKDHYEFALLRPFQIFRWNRNKLGLEEENERKTEEKKKEKNGKRLTARAKSFPLCFRLFHRHSNFIYYYIRSFGRHFVPLVNFFFPLIATPLLFCIVKILLRTLLNGIFFRFLYSTVYPFNNFTL